MNLLTKTEFVKHIRNQKLADREFVETECRKIAFDTATVYLLTRLAMGEARPPRVGEYVKDRVWKAADNFAKERWAAANPGGEINGSE